MIKNMNKNLDNKRIWLYIILFLIIFTQALYITYCFATKKKDFHSDEIWSYGPANNYETPFFYATDDWKDQNKNEWLPGQRMKEYLSVEKGERFAYAHIYENTSRDLHQPLYFFILNTICSFFPGRFSWWYGFVLNIVFFMIGQFFLFLLVHKITDNDYLSLIICFTYGFSQAAINTYVYIRMYAMITCLGLISAYLHSVIYKEPEKMKRILPAIWAVTVAGGMTHSFFLAFAGILSACFCFYYLIKREWKHLLIYALVLLSAAGTVFLFYPQTISHAETYEGRNNIENGYAGLWFEYRYLITFMCNEAFGVLVSPFAYYWDIYLVEFLLLAFMIVLPMSFLLRKEEWFRKFIKEIWEKIKKIPHWLYHECNWMPMILALTGYGVILVTARMAHVFNMGQMATRYIFIIEPYLFLVLFLLAAIFVKELVKLLKWVLEKIKVPVSNKIGDTLEKIIIMALSAVLLINIFFHAATPYYFDYSDEIDFYLTSLPRDANYIILLKDYWLLDSLCNSLYGVENFFAADYYGIFEEGSQISQLESNEAVYLIMSVPSLGDVSEDIEEVIEINEEYDEMRMSLLDVENEKVSEFLGQYQDFFLQLDICDEFLYAGISEIFGRKVFVFRLRE